MTIQLANSTQACLSVLSGDRLVALVEHPDLGSVSAHENP